MTMPEEMKINKTLFLLLIISVLIRGFLAAWLEFGNDEVYYWTYAKFPDWSHFDHPGMVGWVIQLFSLNLLFDSEFFIRLSSVIFMTANTCIIFRIGKEIKDAQTGLYAAFLYTASIYAFVITGVFIMPDTPMSLFWLLGFWMFAKYFTAEKPKNLHLILAGLFCGLCILSKYTGAFLWIGAGLYILLFDRKQLKKPALYLSLFITAICCFPILYWNYQNDFISFSFHGDRVSLFAKPTFNYIGTELAGEFFYNNPVNFVLTIIAIIALIKNKIEISKITKRLLLLTALPMIFLFWLFALTRPTLPHWNAPAFVLLILAASAYLSGKETNPGKLFPKWIKASLMVTFIVAIVGSIEIKTGFIPLDKHTEETQIGKDDFTLDMYGWHQLGEKFAVFRNEKIADGTMCETDAIVCQNWFPAANIDYYLARPLNMTVLGLGHPENIHKYMWINEERGGLQRGNNYWFITDSHYFHDPTEIYTNGMFSEIELLGQIPIERCGKTVKNCFVYKCSDLHYFPKSLQELKSGRLDESERP